ncbi:hypothetical protein AFLA_005808 [Aspergillus flavus NRRL3357]|nr:hypothetical protein AFLA_005808 [Aspergillus flavus NRRL3357]
MAAHQVDMSIIASLEPYQRVSFQFHTRTCIAQVLLEVRFLLTKDPIHPIACLYEVAPMAFVDEMGFTFYLIVVR